MQTKLKSPIFRSYDQSIHRSAFGGFNWVVIQGSKIFKALVNRKLTLEFLGHLKAFANSGILVTVPSTRNLVGE